MSGEISLNRQVSATKTHLKIKARVHKIEHYKSQSRKNINPPNTST